MFGSNGRNPFACRGVGCVKLPATAAFPTDDKLLQRIEAARRVLPRNNIKALWRAPQAVQAPPRAEPSMRSVELEALSDTDDSRAAIQRFRIARAELRSTLLRMEEQYSGTRAAAG